MSSQERETLCHCTLNQKTYLTTLLTLPLPFESLELKMLADDLRFPIGHTTTRCPRGYLHRCIETGIFPFSLLSIQYDQDKKSFIPDLQLKDPHRETTPLLSTELIRALSFPGKIQQINALLGKEGGQTFIEELLEDYFNQGYLITSGEVIFKSRIFSNHAYTDRKVDTILRLGERFLVRDEDNSFLQLYSGLHLIIGPLLRQDQAQLLKKWFQEITDPHTT